MRAVAGGASSLRGKMLIGYCLVESEGGVTSRSVAESTLLARRDALPPTAGSEPSEAAALRALGCEHVFSDIDDDRRIDRPGLRAALDFARVGDVLVVPALNHLGVDVEAVVRIVASLSRKGVTIQLGHMPMDMMIPTGEALAFACRALAQLSEPAPTPATTSGGPRRRGRPQSLSNKDIAKAHRLLASGNAVPDVARALGVSPATVYRIFPRRPPKAGHADDSGS